MSALKHMAICPTNHRSLHLCLHVKHDCLLLFPVCVLVRGIFRCLCTPVQMTAVNITSLCHVYAVLQEELGRFFLGMIPEVVCLPLVVVDRFTMSIPQPQIWVRGQLLAPPVDWIGLD